MKMTKRRILAGLGIAAIFTIGLATWPYLTRYTAAEAKGLLGEERHLSQFKAVLGQADEMSAGGCLLK